MSSNRFVDPKVLMEISNLQLLAKVVVDGFVSGMHRSPYHGFSLDFLEYREYAPGDDVRTIDWKVYGRSDRFYVKKFEGDTNTRLHILLDTSKSMGFTSHKVSKLDYGRFLAAALAFFSHRQRDAAGLITFDSHIVDHIQPSTRTGQLQKILSHLDRLETGEQTDIRAVLEELSLVVRKRSVVVLISDFYQEPNELARALRFFHFRGNDIILFHILDPMEIDLPIGKTSTLEDMETLERIPYDPETSRPAYLKMLRTHIDGLQKECRSHAIDYVLINTEEPLDLALRRYLALRARQY